MRRLTLYVIAFGLLSAGCPKRTVVPDPTVPHQISKATDVEVWCGVPEQKLVRCKVRAEAGWWIASPQVVE